MTFEEAKKQCAAYRDILEDPKAGQVGHLNTKTIDDKYRPKYPRMYLYWSPVILWIVLFVVLALILGLKEFNDVLEGRAIWMLPYMGFCLVWLTVGERKKSRVRAAHDKAILAAMERADASAEAFIAWAAAKQDIDLDGIRTVRERMQSQKDHLVAKLADLAI